MLATENILDPRFKKMMVHFIFPKVYGDQSAYQVKTERAFNPLGEVVKEYESKHATSEDEGDFEKGSVWERYCLG